MALAITEKDWKHLRDLQESLIERYCLQTLSNIRRIADPVNPESSLLKYQKIYRYLEKRGKTLDVKLNDSRRSNAIYKIVGIYQLGLFLDEEYDKFSDEIKHAVKVFLDLK